MATVPKDLGRQIIWEHEFFKPPKAFVYCINEIRRLREVQLKPGVRDALAKSN